MTEDEAKTKWCPMYRRSAGCTGNDDADNRDWQASKCLGSECMAWRVDDKYGQTNCGGFCGLADKP